MELKVCIGSACHIKGSQQVIKIFQELIDTYKLKNQVELKACFCMGHCTNAVSVQIDEEPVYGVQGENAEQFFIEHIVSQKNND